MHVPGGRVPGRYDREPSMALTAALQLRQTQRLALTPQLMQSIRMLQMTGQELADFLREQVEANPLLRMERSARNMPPPESLAAPGPTLRQAVEFQILHAFAGDSDRQIARLLADGLDEAGYLDREVEDEAIERFGRAAVARVLAACQERSEPAGLFARSLAECLAIQLRRVDRCDPAMAALLDNLDLLARRDFAELARRCGVEPAEIADMLDEIRALSPKPGTAFSASVDPAIIPELILEAGEDGGWKLSVNPDALPRVLVDEEYRAEIDASLSRPEERAFLSSCLNEANWLVRSLDQRARTTLRVGAEIVRRQDDFLRHGPGHLKPMTLRMVAEAIDMHESTVSRVTAGRFMATPRGVFELRDFFSTALAAGADGEAHSAESVQHRIRALIDAEPADGVLSDDALVDILRREGINIARRTVAKYREAMQLPSSVQRRREKQARAAMLQDN